MSDTESLVWACSCKHGGVARAVGVYSARQKLEEAVGEHLRGRGNEGHSVDFGTIEGSVRLDPEPRPLMFS